MIPEHIANFEGQGVQTTRISNGALSGVANSEKFNAAMIEWKGKRLMAYRRYDPERFLRSHKGNHTMNIAISELGDGWIPNGTHTIPIMPIRTGDERYEDPRLFIYDGSLWLGCTEVTTMQGGWACNQRLFRLDDRLQIQHVVNLHLGKNFKGRHHAEKNWTYFEHDGALFVIYDIQRGQIYEINPRTGQIGDGHTRQEALHWPYGHLRGGTTPVKLEDGTWLKVAHSASDDNWSATGGKRRYSMSAVIFEDKPPFNILKISKEPMLFGSRFERWCGHGNSQCVFPAGLIVDGNTWHVSGGVNDTFNAIWHFEAQKCLDGLVDVSYFEEPHFAYFFSRKPSGVRHIIGVENKWKVTKVGGNGMEGVMKTEDIYAIADLREEIAKDNPYIFEISEGQYQEKIKGIYND